MTTTLATPKDFNQFQIGKIMAALSALVEGQTITYDELTAAIERKITEHRPLLYSAKKRLMKEGMVFGTIMAVGLKRLTDKEKVSATDGHITRARRTAKGGLRVLHATDCTKLDRDTKTDHSVKASVLGVIASMGTAKAQKTLRPFVESNAAALNYEDTLKALSEDAVSKKQPGKQSADSNESAANSAAETIRSMSK